MINRIRIIDQIFTESSSSIDSILLIGRKLLIDMPDLTDLGGLVLLPPLPNKDSCKPSVLSSKCFFVFKPEKKNKVFSVSFFREQNAKLVS